jgi:hypothetical protein
MTTQTKALEAFGPFLAAYLARKATPQPTYFGRRCFRT